MERNAINTVTKLITSLRVRWADEPDDRLLAAYVLNRNQDALAALITRHGPGVWALCRRLLRCPHDAEDAFQATFLALVQNVHSLKGSLGGWLYTVAVRTITKARAAAQLRAKKERSAFPRTDTESDPAAHERDATVAREVSRLPGIYRDVVVLCDLQGRTRAEAARVLGCPEGTIAGRLARGRGILARRFTRLGLQPGAAGLLVALSANRCAGISHALVERTLLGTATVVPSGTIGTLLAGLLVVPRWSMHVAAAIGMVAAGGLLVSIPTRSPDEDRQSAMVAAAMPNPDRVAHRRVRDSEGEREQVKFGFAVAKEFPIDESRVDHHTVTTTVTEATVVDRLP